MRTLRWLLARARPDGSVPMTLALCFAPHPCITFIPGEAVDEGGNNLFETPLLQCQPFVAGLSWSSLLVSLSSAFLCLTQRAKTVWQTT